MKKILLSYFLLIPVLLSAQELKLSGKIQLSKDGNLSGITVLIFQQDAEAFYKATTTKNDGEFVFSNLRTGKYSIKINHNGYNDYVSDGIELQDKSIDLAPIPLLEKINQLSEVTISVKKPMIQVLADKTVFNVQNTINATGSSGFDLLRKAPGIIIDNNDNLIVEGKTGVLIYIDGKQSYLIGSDLTNFLKTLQSSDIDSIEIITQPSSKYDAAGNAGIVNIKLKKNKKFGSNGSASSGSNIGKYQTAISSLSLNNRNKKNNLYGNYSNRFGADYNFINLYREQNNAVFDSKSDSKNATNANNIKLGYDYYANATNTFGFAASGNFNNSFNDNDTRTPIRAFNAVVNDSILVARSVGQNRTYNLYGNANYKYVDSLGVSLNIDADYGKYDSKKTNYQPNAYLNPDETITLNENNTFQNTPVNIDIATFKTDYEQNFWKGKISIGAKTSFVQTNNTLAFFTVIDDVFALNPNRSNQFFYTENVNAVYFNFNRTFKKFNFQIGLRVENTNSNGNLVALIPSKDQQVKRHYTDFFPSGGITYQMNEKNAFAFTSSKRIERPNYQSLNPFEYQIDELSFSRGNPFLKPQYTNNVKLSHTHNYSLNTSLSYSYVSDFFAQVIEAADATKSFLTSRNVANEQVINLGVSYPYEINKWWNIYFSVNAFQSKYIATNPSFISTKQETLSFYGQNNFSLPKGINLEISGWYSSPAIWGGTFQTNSIGSLDVAVQKQFINKKLTCRLAVSDVLYTSPWGGSTQFANVVIRGTGGSDSRQLRFNLSYNFGNDAVKKSRERNTGLEDEKNRIGS